MGLRVRRVQRMGPGWQGAAQMPDCLHLWVGPNEMKLPAAQGLGLYAVTRAEKGW